MSDESVTISDIMTTAVVTTTPETSIGEIAEILNQHGFSGLPVIDESGILVGMVSEFDVISKRGATAADIMSRGVISVGDEASADQVTNIMGLHGIRRVPVVRDGRLVGIVSRSDLLKLYGDLRWTCQQCGDFQRGFGRPDHCARCGSTVLILERERRTTEGF